MSTCLKWINRVICFLLTFALAAALFAASAATLAILLLKSGGFHGMVASDGAVLDQQIARIEERVRKLGDKTPFDADGVLAAITREDVAAYGRQARAWWMQLYLANPNLLAPKVELPQVEAALAEDATFRATQTDTTFKSAIRDDVMPRIAQAVQESVLPLRADLVSFGLSKVLDRVDVVRYTNLLEWVPLLLWVAAFLLGDLLMLLNYRRGRTGWLYVGWGISAAGLGLLAMVIALISWQIPSLIRTGNTLLAFQGDLLVRNVLILTILCTLVMVGAGTWLVRFSATHRKENHGHNPENQPV